MRTIVFILSGCFIGVLLVYLTSMLAKTREQIILYKNRSFYLFALLWLIVSVVNLTTGMSHGYSFFEELPIFLIIFIIPLVIVRMLLFKKRK